MKVAARGANVVVNTADDSNLERRSGVGCDGRRSFSWVGAANHDD